MAGILSATLTVCRRRRPPRASEVRRVAAVQVGSLAAPNVAAAEVDVVPLAQFVVSLEADLVRVRLAADTLRGELPHHLVEVAGFVLHAVAVVALLVVE